MATRRSQNGKIPADEASGQQPDAITSLNERQLHVHVVDFSRYHGGEAGMLQRPARSRCLRPRWCSLRGLEVLTQRLPRGPRGANEPRAIA